MLPKFIKDMPKGSERDQVCRAYKKLSKALFAQIAFECGSDERGPMPMLFMSAAIRRHNAKDLA